MKQRKHKSGHRSPESHMPTNHAHPSGVREACTVPTFSGKTFISNITHLIIWPGVAGQKGTVQFAFWSQTSSSQGHLKCCVRLSHGNKAQHNLLQDLVEMTLHIISSHRLFSTSYWWQRFVCKMSPSICWVNGVDVVYRESFVEIRLSEHSQAKTKANSKPGSSRTNKHLCGLKCKKAADSQPSGNLCVCDVKPTKPIFCGDDWNHQTLSFIRNV